MTRATRTTTDVTCPFCGLLCDDLVVASDGTMTTVVANGCARARTGFAQTGTPAEPAIGGRRCTLDQAVAHAARILRHANQPLIGGLGTDAAGCRAAMALAEKSGAAVDHMHGRAISANAQVLQRRGWIMTTLTEVRNRADVVVLFGTDGDSVNPRFSERCLRPAPGRQRSRRPRRQVVYIGEDTQARSVRRAVPGVSIIRCRQQDYLTLLSSLRVLLAGRGELATDGRARLAALADLLRGADYAVLAWAAGQLPADHTDLIVEILTEIIASLNAHTRAAGLPLGGNDGATTAVNVCAWQTGYPLRVNFAGGAPSYEPSHNAADAMLQRGEADALLWISSWRPVPPPAGGRLPTVALTAPSRRIAGLVDVHIPVAMPGVEASGTLFRVDSVVGLPLRPVRATGLLPAAEILSRIQAQL